MNRQEVKEKAEQIWKSENPSEIDSFNQEKNNFIEAFMKGFDYAVDSFQKDFYEIVKENCGEEYAKEVFGT